MFCTGCGHRLGAGRFCTNCGRPIPVDARADSSGEHPAVPAPPTPPPATPPPTRPPSSAPPPPAYEAPPPPRYPLFVDELYVAPTAPRADQPPAAAPPQAAPPPARRPGQAWLPWILTVVVVVLMALIGGMLLVSGGADEAGDASPANGTANETGPTSRPPQPSPTETPPPADGPQDLASYTAASAPKTARPNLDTQGNRVRYDAANMLDGVAQTCWRMPGDGTGQELTFTLPGQIELSEVGLINGYAKSAGRLDWYAGNRRIQAVEWEFEDGTVVSQSLTETRDMQSIQIDPVTTSSVVLRLVSVSKPGKGPSARNYTPISDVTLVGRSV